METARIMNELRLLISLCSQIHGSVRELKNNFPEYTSQGIEAIFTFYAQKLTPSIGTLKMFVDENVTAEQPVLIQLNELEAVCNNISQTMNTPNTPPIVKRFILLIAPILNNIRNFRQNSAPTQLNQQDDPFQLPDILNTPMALKYFEQARELGLIQKGDDRYTWNGNKKELALFAELMSERLNIKEKWKVWENVFGVSGLATAKYKAREVDGRYGNNESSIKGLFN